MSKGKLRGPWGEVQNALSKRDRDLELDHLMRSGLATEEQLEALKDRTVTPVEELSEDPKFLDQVFPKGKKKK